MCKLDLKDAYLCSIFSGQPKESGISMGRNSVPVSMPVLWPCTSPIYFHKTPKDRHGPFKRDRDTHSDLFGRYVDYWQNKGRALRDTVIILLQYLGFVKNQKKTVMTPVQER